MSGHVNLHRDMDAEGRLYLFRKSLKSENMFIGHITKVDWRHAYSFKIFRLITKLPGICTLFFLLILISNYGHSSITDT